MPEEQYQATTDFMTPLFQLVFILVSGTFCQIVGWHLKIPSILLLLLVGILSGPVLGLLQPDALMGQALMPLVELAVAIILFEGGLSLKKTELGQVGPIVLRLITVCTLITMGLLSTLAVILLDLNIQSALLLGAILVVSGPTVIIPLLRLIRVRAPVEAILRWEGIIIDPIGVLLSVLVAELCEFGIGFSAPWHIISGMIIAISIGGISGWLGAHILKLIIGQHRVPDQLIIPISLAVLFSLVLISNILHEQAGLLCSTIMGLFVARNHGAWVRTLEDFIGHSQRMFIGILFIVLAARLDPMAIQHLDLNLSLFILAAIFIVRPIAVFASTLRSNLEWREKAALSALAPRGIVSAALASALSAALMDSGIPGIETIAPYTFAMIIGTVTFYGLFSPLFMKLLKFRQSENQGILFVGGGHIAVHLAKIINKEGFRAVLVDTNELNVRRAKQNGVESYHGNILSNTIQEDLDLEGIGNLLAFTSNDEANSLAALEFRNVFGAAHVFQLSPALGGAVKISGRVFPSNGLSLEKIEELWGLGYRFYIRSTAETISQKTNTQSTEKKDEYALFEIEGNCLHIVAQDGLSRATKSKKVILFGQEN